MIKANYIKKETKQKTAKRKLGNCEDFINAVFCMCLPYQMVKVYCIFILVYRGDTKKINTNQMRFYHNILTRWDPYFVARWCLSKSCLMLSSVSAEFEFKGLISLTLPLKSNGMGRTLSLERRRTNLGEDSGLVKRSVSWSWVERNFTKSVDKSWNMTY